MQKQKQEPFERFPAGQEQTGFRRNVAEDTDMAVSGTFEKTELVT